MHNLFISRWHLYGLINGAWRCCAGCSHFCDAVGKVYLRLSVRMAEQAAVAISECIANIHFSFCPVAYPQGVQRIHWAAKFCAEHIFNYSNIEWRFALRFSLIVFIHFPRNPLPWFKCFCRGWTTPGLRAWPFTTSLNRNRTFRSEPLRSGPFMSVTFRPGRFGLGHFGHNNSVHKQLITFVSWMIM